MHYRTKKKSHYIETLKYRRVKRVVITLNAVHPSIWCQQLFGANSRCHSIRSRLAHPVSWSLIDSIDQTQTQTQNTCNSIYFSLSLPKCITQSTAILLFTSMPINRSQLMWPLTYDACQNHFASHFHVNVRRSHDNSFGFCK